MKTGTLGLLLCLLASCPYGCSEEEPERVYFHAFRMCAEAVPPQTNAVAVTATIFTSRQLNRLVFTPYVIKNGVVTKLKPMSLMRDTRWESIALGFYLTRVPGPEGTLVYRACLNPINPLPITELRGYDHVIGPNRERSMTVGNEADQLHVRVLLCPPGTEDVPGSAANADSIASLIEHSKEYGIDYFGFNIQARSRE